MMLIGLADVARRTGFPVVEVPGWKTRTRPGGMTGVRTIVAHHTVDNPPADYPSLAVVRDGRPDLAGPLAQYGIGRSGTIYVIAAGRCNHAGAVLNPSWANEYAIGIEAANNGTDEPWGAKIMASYAGLCAELMAEFAIPLRNVLGHKEVCAPPGRKSDPSFAMDRFRASILARKAIPPTPPAPVVAQKVVTMFTCVDFNETLWLIENGTRRKVTDPAIAHTLNEAGIPNVGKVASNVLGFWPVAA